MKLCQLPQSTPYDPAEDPPGSVDPLGTVTGAEQLAEVLLPGLTARMWRARLLTFSALAAEVAKRVAAGRDDQLLDARLAFERLFVSAIARQDDGDPERRNASRRLPGIGLARQALRAQDQPLERANFLKGQGVNGPFGVISRLARDVEAIDETGHAGRHGVSLLLAWAEDQCLPGLLDEGPGRTDGGRKGSLWLQKVVRQVSSCVGNQRKWPATGWQGWSELAERLRLDRIGSRESAVLAKLLSHDPLGLRGHVVERLENAELFSTYSTTSEADGPRAAEKEIVHHLASTADDEIGRTVQTTVRMIDAYEQLSGLLESVFRGVVWGLTRNHGQAEAAALVHDSALRPFLAEIHAQLGTSTRTFQKRLSAFEADSLAAHRLPGANARLVESRACDSRANRRPPVAGPAATGRLDGDGRRLPPSRPAKGPFCGDRSGRERSAITLGDRAAVCVLGNPQRRRGDGRDAIRPQAERRRRPGQGRRSPGSRSADPRLHRLADRS